MSVSIIYIYFLEHTHKKNYIKICRFKTFCSDCWAAFVTAVEGLLNSPSFHNLKLFIAFYTATEWVVAFVTHNIVTLKTKSLYDARTVVLCLPLKQNKSFQRSAWRISESDDLLAVLFYTCSADLWNCIMLKWRRPVTKLTYSRCNPSRLVKQWMMESVEFFKTR